MARVKVKTTGEALGAKTSSLDQALIPEIAVPFTSISSRAPILDVSTVATPRMGIERIHVGGFELLNELGPNGESIYNITPDDQLDRIRMINGAASGSYSFSNNDRGIYISAGSTAVSYEVTFYGTGLNIAGVSMDSSADWRVSIDGGSEGSNVLADVAGQSTVLNNRNYGPRTTFNIVSGLAAGLHTVSIRQNSSAWTRLQGFEILNEPAVEATPLEIQAGNIAVDEELFDVPTSALSYNTDFDASSDAVGTKGGHVVVYAEKLNGVTSVKKRLSATNAAQLNLGAADRSNEEVIARHNFRQFKYGPTGQRFDTLKSLASGGLQDVASTLEDGTTTLVGNDIYVSSFNTRGFAIDNSTSAFFTLTFVGTGVSFVASGDGIPPTGMDVQIDGSSIGSLSLTASSTDNTYDIVSGLPYGTHTFRLQGVGGSDGSSISSFIIYGPKKAEVPAGSTELGSYYLMADHVANTTADVLNISTGALRKAISRELVYEGAWTLTTAGSAITAINGHSINTAGNGDSFSYSFFGTGLEFRGAGDASMDMDVTLDDGTGPLAVTTANFPTATTSGYGALSHSLSTGKTTGSANTFGSGAIIKDLPLKHYTVKYTNAGATSQRLRALDIITPIHTPDADRNNLHSKPIGSNSIKNEVALPNYPKGKQHFPDGIDLGAGKTKWQKKTLATSKTTAAVEDLLIFSGLTIGRAYRVTMQAKIDTEAVSGTRDIQVNAVHNGIAVLNIRHHIIGTDTDRHNTVWGVSGIFTAVNSTLAMTGYAGVNGTISAGTFMILEELPGHIEIDEW